jgi:hypothetical protein
MKLMARETLQSISGKVKVSKYKNMKSKNEASLELGTDRDPNPNRGKPKNFWST